MSPSDTAFKNKWWPIVLIVLILTIVPAYVKYAMPASLPETATAEEEEILKQLTNIQYITFFFVLILFTWHQRRLIRFLVPLMSRNLIVSGEMIALLAIVYGAFTSLGLPELFWDRSPITVGVAGFASAAFLALAWYSIYLVDYTRPLRRRSRRLEWTRLEPIIQSSGLPSLLRIGTDTTSSRWQLEWFVVVACLPGLFLLALPAVLPAIRPTHIHRFIEWPWLLGIAAAIVLPQLLLMTRTLSRFLSPNGKEAGPSKSYRLPSEIFHRLEVLPCLLVLVYLASLLADRFIPNWVVPAGLLCLLFAMIAVVVTYVSSIRSPRAWLLVITSYLTLLFLSGLQTYHFCYRGLEKYYPPDPLHQLLGLRSPFTEPTTLPAARPARNEAAAAIVKADDSQPNPGMPIDLIKYQERELNTNGEMNRLASFEQRQQLLNVWKNRLAAGHSAGGKPRKPILVAVATCGGALRAGLWTATVLDAIREKLPEFPSHVRYVTGASGGMVGASMFVTSQARAPEEPANSIRPLLKERLSEDYLSPIARQFILRDAVSFLFPWRHYHDRGQALEDALIHDTKPDPGSLLSMNSTFQDLRGYEERGEIPSIVYSPMLVEDGRRLLISNLQLADVATIDGDSLLAEERKTALDTIQGKQGNNKELPADVQLEFARINAISAVEFFRLFPEARETFKIVTAVRMNATFPFITPTGVLPTDSPRQVVDAGYYDNYGVDLATFLLFTHRQWIAENTSGVILVQIRAFRNEKQLKVLDEPILAKGLASAPSSVIDILARSVRWITSPVHGLAEARQAVMYYRNGGQIIMLDRFFRDRFGDDSDFFRTVIFTCSSEIPGTTDQHIETLNWHLSEQEMQQVKKNMTDRDQNNLRLEEMARWWHDRMLPESQ